MSAFQQLVEKHSKLLEDNPYAYFELAYTRQTEWMAWLGSCPKDANPNRKVIAKGQGSSAEEACADAMRNL